MAINSPEEKIKHGSVGIPIAGFERHSDGSLKYDVAVSEIVDLVISETGMKDAKNSTNTNLGIDGVFVGEAENVLEYAEIVISIFSDQDSATDGVQIQFSPDGSTWKTTDNYSYVDGGNYKTWKNQVIDEYFRMRYVNGGVAQTSFQMSILLRKNVGVQWAHRIKDDISGEDDAGLVKSIIAAERAGGTPDVYTNVQATAAGNLKVSVEEIESANIKHYFSELTLGNITDRTDVEKYGAAPDGLQLTATDVWDRADATPTQQIWIAPTQARIHAIVSTSAQDASGGTGALSIIVYGLTDWDTAEVSETLTLTGAVAVNTVNSYVIIHRMKVVGQSTTTAVGVNVGTITATAAVDGTVTATILPNNGQTEMAIYGVPSVQTALLHLWYAGIDKAQAQARSADFELRVNENPNTQLFGYLRKDDITVQSNGKNADTRNYKIPRKYPGPCIIKVNGTGTVADLDAVAGFDLELVTN